MASVDKAYDLYFQILTLPVELTRYAEQRQELAKQKNCRHTKTSTPIPSS